MLKENINLLMTGGGAPGAYGIIKSLQKDNNIHITAADMRPECIGKLMAHDYIQIPKANNPDFIKTLLQICEDRKIDVLFPLVTKELELFSKNKERFLAIGTQIIVENIDLLQDVNDKGVLYTKLKEHGVSVPNFSIVNNENELIKIAKELDYPEKTICFKPVNSNGMRGFRILHKGKDTFDLWLNEKPGNAYTNWEETIRIINNVNCPPLLVSEFMPGKEYTVDVLRSNGNTLFIIPRLRSKMIGGISVEGIITEDQKVIEYCKEIIKVFPLNGLFGIQVKYSNKNEPLILEINPRVQGTTVACLGAGVNLPLMAVYQILNLLNEEKLPKIKWDTRFIRHWEEKFH